MFTHVSQATRKVIDNRSKHIRPILYQNIVLSGEDISAELEPLLLAAPSSVTPKPKVVITAQKECKLSPWVGMSLLACLESRERPVLEVDQL